jgi:SNF2 family DNA or RNA helicase
MDAFQEKIIAECLQKGSGGLSVPMGSGKTRMGLLLCQHYMKDSLSLVVVSKTLIEVWRKEIEKFFGSSLKYRIYHKEYMKDDFDTFVPEPGTVIITTFEVLTKLYTQQQIERAFVTIEYRNNHVYRDLYSPINIYNRPTQPFSTQGIIYSRVFDCLVVDEVHNHTNISTKKCRAISSVCAKHRWALSGTMFNEPRVERILGFYLIIDHPSFCRNLPDATEFISSPNFKGINESLVIRHTNEGYTPTKLNEIIIKHDITADEQKIYVTLKKIINQLNIDLNKAKMGFDSDGVKRINGQLLKMINYLRQAIVCPLLPYANIALDLIRMSTKSKMARMFMDQFDKLDLNEYLSSEESIRSSRITEILKVVDSLPNKRITVFSCFKKILHLLIYYIRGRPIFFMDSRYSSETREKMLKSFSRSNNGILFTTYKLGGEGLNLTECNTVLLCDLWWNEGTTNQAISRFLRTGQLSDVTAYYFTSNTGIENAVFKKQSDKIKILQEIKSGPCKHKMERISLKFIIQCINADENMTLLQCINKSHAARPLKK